MLGPSDRGVRGRRGGGEGGRDLRGAYHLSSPVSFLSRFAFFARMIGGYVSGMPNMTRMVQSPAKMVVVQNTHLQLYIDCQRAFPSLQCLISLHRLRAARLVLTVPETWMYPEMMGPIEGPANGARAKILIALPRRSPSQISLNSAPALLMGTEAKTPLRKRMMSRPGRLLTRALATCSAV